MKLVRLVFALVVALFVSFGLLDLGFELLLHAAHESLQSHPNPVPDYAAAVSRFREIQKIEGPELDPVCRSILLTHGIRTERAIVFLHGYTNCPQQFRELGQIFFDMGDNVLILRLPRLRSAHANLAAAQGQLTQARNNFERQRRLLERGVTSRADFDQAQEGLQTAQARVDDAEAQVKIASDRLSFTELMADAAGTVTARGAEAGEVVQAGQMIVRIARQDGRDAVFDVPAQLLRSAPADAQITVHLTEDPSVTAEGRVREVGRTG